LLATGAPPAPVDPVFHFKSLDDAKLECISLTRRKSGFFLGGVIIVAQSMRGKGTEHGV
jgi:hypothetical protein